MKKSNNKNEFCDNTITHILNINRKINIKNIYSRKAQILSDFKG